MGYTRYTGTNPVWTGSAPGLATENVDLSSYITGSDRVVAVFAYGRTGGSDSTNEAYAIFFNTDNVRNLEEDYGGGSSYLGPDGPTASYNEFVDEYSIICCLTSATQTISFHYHDTGTEALAIHLLGWFSIDEHNPTASGSADFSYGSYPQISGGTNWASAQTTDLSGFIGATYGAAFIQAANINHNKIKVFRPYDGLFGEFSNQPVGPSSCKGSSSWGSYSDLDSVAFVPTDSSGKIEGGTNAASLPNQTLDLFVLASAEDWQNSNTLVGNNVSISASGTFETLDISSVGHGSKAIGVYLHIRKVSGSGTSVASFRPSSSTIDFRHDGGSLSYAYGAAKVDVEEDAHVFCPTSADGGLEWTCYGSASEFDITVIGYIDGLAPPTITNISPDGTSEIPTADLSFSTEDEDDGAESNTIDLEITDADGTYDAIINGSFQTPDWDGTITANADGGHDIVLSTHPNFAIGAMSATASVEDAGGNSGTDTWTWTTVSWESTISYINRVHDVQSSDEFVSWATADPDTTGSSYPGPGVSGVDTSDHCICHVILDITQYINRCVDRTTGDFVFWLTSSPDPDGLSYPGPGGPNDMQDYCVQKIIYDEWDSWRQ